MAARILGYERVEIVNLISVATDTVLDIAAAGDDQVSWLASRPQILNCLDHADAVLLGWGCTEPSGPARHHHRTQVEWLKSTLANRRLKTWTVGGTPRHPSRWQRYTARAYPGTPFSVALANALISAASMAPESLSP
jgi:hypothetical protein